MASRWKESRIQRSWRPSKSVGMWPVCWWWTPKQRRSSRGAVWPPPRITSPVRSQLCDTVWDTRCCLAVLFSLWLPLPRSLDGRRATSCPPPHVPSSRRKLIQTHINWIRQIIVWEPVLFLRCNRRTTLCLLHISQPVECLKKKVITVYHEACFCCTGLCL